MAIAPPPNDKQPGPTPQPLSFPALTYAKLSPSPFLRAHLTSGPPIRPNARAPSTFRAPTVHTGSLTHANGSAVVRVGDTAVVCGIRAEILKASDVPDYRVPQKFSEGRDTGDGDSLGEAERTARERKRKRQDKDALAHLDLLVPNIELATGCSPAFIPGNPPSTLAQSLSQRVLTLLHISDLISLTQLQIWHHPRNHSTSTSTQVPAAHATTASTAPDAQVMDLEEAAEGADEEADAQQPGVKAFWTLYIDILFISLDGNPFDAAWAAVLAALQDTKLPRAWWDPDREMVLCDERVSESQLLRLGKLPIASTFGVFQSGAGAKRESERGVWILADPDDFEESLCEETVTVVVDGDGKGGRVLRIEKSGGGAVGLVEMKGCVEMAGRRWREWRDVLGTVK
ncbi:hypothetical protein MMC19_003846 [Ptychographa xylographoides]|nr:hypothetical protein [Ptychographa xylographoides]